MADAPSSPEPHLRLAGSSRRRNYRIEFDRPVVVEVPRDARRHDDRPRTAARPRRAEPSQPVAELSATDPRWVLAVRVSQVMQGAIVTAEARDRLVQIGRLMGLSVFDCNLIIAIMQDRARRGQSLGDAASDLCMVNPPRRTTQPAWWKIAWIAAALLVAEMLLIVTFAM